MASLNMLISEIAHEIGRPNNAAVRETIKHLLIQTRNEVIRRSYENHSYVDRVLIQRYKVSLIDVIDGDIQLPLTVATNPIPLIKRTTQVVPRPVRLTNNLPFDRVSTIGYKYSKEIPFIKETTARFRNNVPGLCGSPCYDYINGYIYIFPINNKTIDFNNIIIESAFEHPTPIEIDNGVATALDSEFDENEWLFSEDMIGQIKEIILKRDLVSNIKETNE